MKKIVIDARESGTTTGRYIDKLVEYLHKLKPAYDITVLTTKRRSEFMKTLAPKFTVVETRYKEFTFGEQLGLWKQLHGLKPDLVHFGMVQQPILYQGKVVTTMHDLTTLRFRNPSKNLVIFTIKQQLYKFVNYWSAHKSARIITATEFTKDDVAKYTRINSRKVVVTPEAADPILDKPEIVEELVDQPYIMYVGRPLPHKNLDALVDAFALLRQQNPALKLILVGKKSSLFRQLEKRTEVKGIKNVVFFDFATEGQLKWLYENTLAYVFPSLSEGFGLPGLEAMVQGAPVVSSNATCLPEVYKNAAKYFDPTSIEEMAATIQQVIENEDLRKKLIDRGYAVSGSYSWQRMAEQTLAVYDEVLGT